MSESRTSEAQVSVFAIGQFGPDGDWPGPCVSVTLRSARGYRPNPRGDEWEEPPVRGVAFDIGRAERTLPVPPFSSIRPTMM